jgi:EAL domain-containing protein (putative c-di-GMP-specific phosphodiesterase class I)
MDIGIALDIEVAAVGIESECQFERLRQMGCQCLQGFFLARPMSAREFEQRYLKAND